MAWTPAVATYQRPSPVWLERRRAVERSDREHDGRVADTGDRISLFNHILSHPVVAEPEIAGIADGRPPGILDQECIEAVGIPDHQHAVPVKYGIAGHPHA